MMKTSQDLFPVFGSLLLIDGSERVVSIFGQCRVILLSWYGYDRSRQIGRMDCQGTVAHSLFVYRLRALSLPFQDVLLCSDELIVGLRSGCSFLWTYS